MTYEYKIVAQIFIKLMIRNRVTVLAEIKRFVFVLFVFEFVFVFVLFVL